ncbi:MAG TPA: hypothetical protein VG890_01045 [Puia sp.]|nr:hypothetical protein [Puia sp.]
MRNRNTIRKISAFSLLLLFSFSVTPKLLLHQLIANHRDTAYSVSKDQKATVDKAGFNCHAEDLVVNIPFIPGAETVYPVTLPSTLVSFSSKVFDALTAQEFFFELRGPPARA